MTESKRYPQIPTAIWWGFRQMLITKPSLHLTARALAVQFDVQESAAKAYLIELQNTNLLDGDGRATALAKKWRVDETYKEAVGEILANTYPEELIDAVGSEEIDRNKAKQWFVLDGLGAGTANNKAATMALISASKPGEALPSHSKSKMQENQKVSKNPFPKNDDSGKPQKTHNNRRTSDIGPLNVNVQIHISADATQDQIETIFASMKKYLRDD